jgi:hypothetical protein
MKQVLVWRVLYTSIARVHAVSAAEAVDRAHLVAGAALKRAHEVTPALAEAVDIENIDMIDAYFCGVEEVPRTCPSSRFLAMTGVAELTYRRECAPDLR